MKDYEVDMIGDVLDSVAESVRQAKRLRDEGGTPKWLLIAVHSAVQGAMVCALDQGNGIAAMKEEDAKRWLAAHERSRTDEAVRYPDTKLDYFLSLYAKVKEPKYMSHFVAAQPFRPIDHDESMRQLNDLRNGFIHFHVGGWSIEKALVVECVERATDIVGFLVDSPIFPWHRRDVAAKERDALTRDLAALSACVADLC